MGLIHRTLAVGSFQCNCHVLADERTKEAVIVDPGDEPEEILQVVKDLGVSVKALLHTHCHLDHITGTRRAACTSRPNAKPSISGMKMSVRMRSGVHACAIASAARPPLAARTSCPAP